MKERAPPIKSPIEAPAPRRLATRRAARSMGPQCKLLVGRADDRYEREAERMASHVMSLSVPSAQHHPVSVDGARTVRRFVDSDIESIELLDVHSDEQDLAALFDDEEQADGIVQRKSLHGGNEPGLVSRADSGLAERIRSPSAGRPLSPAARDFMEPRFGADFSKVRVHAGSANRRDARALNARAFTYGHHIWMGPGESDANLPLMAHELTHVVQQRPEVRRKPSNQPPVSTVAPRVQRALDLGDTANRWLMRLPGFGLLAVVLGRNPLTDQPVARTPETILEAVAGLIPGASIVIEQLKKSGILSKLDSAVDDIVAGSKSLLRNASLFVGYLADITWFEAATNWDGVTAQVRQLYNTLKLRSKIVAFGNRLFGMLYGLVFEGVLKRFGFWKSSWRRVIRKIAALGGKVMRNPGAVLKNLASALQLGFEKFRKRIDVHLKKGLLSWVFGTFGNTNIEIPKTFDARGFVSIILQVLRDRVVARLKKRLGPERAHKAEALFGKVLAALRIAGSGLAKLIDQVSEAVKEGIRNWLITTVVKKAVMKVVGLLNPAGALFQAGLAIYNTVAFLVEEFRRLVTLVRTVLSAISNIVKGVIEPASKRVEEVMARSLPLVISFLARQIGLGGIGKAVRGVIKKLAAKIDALVRKLVRRVVGGTRKSVARAKTAARTTVDKIASWWKARFKFRVGKNERHALFFTGSGRSARLKVASVKGEDYASFLKRVQELIDKLPSGDPRRGEATTALAAARKAHDGIETAKKGKSDKASKKIMPYVSEIAKQSKILARLLGGDEPPSVIRHGKVTDQGGGIWAHAEILSKARSLGATPQQAQARGQIWKQAQRRNVSGTVYLQGHLLNHNLGGASRVWNLAPITGTGSKHYGIPKNANKIHQNEIEDDVKESVKKHVVRYRVDADYERHPKRNSTRQLERIVDQLQGTRRDNVREDLKLRHYEERHFATRLRYEAYTLRFERKSDQLLSYGDWKDDKKIGRDSIPLPLPGHDSALPLKDLNDPHLVTDVDGITSNLSAPATSAEKVDPVKKKDEVDRIYKKYGPITK